MIDKLEIETIIPYIHDGGVGVQIKSGRPIENGYHKGGRELWKHALTSLLYREGIPCDQQKHIDIRGTTILIAIPGVTIDLRKFRNAIDRSQRLTVVGDTPEEQISLSELLQPQVAA